MEIYSNELANVGILNLISHNRKLVTDNMNYKTSQIEVN